MIKKLLWSAFSIMFSMTVSAQVTVELEPEKDNSMYSESENSNGLGRLFSGTNCDSNFRRALLEFDIAGMVPVGATITEVNLILNLDNASPGAGTQNYSLFRVDTEWGEGASSGAGEGDDPIAPDATWTYNMYDTDEWDNLGGDFSGSISATIPVDEALTDYTWSSATMISNVQNWLDYPSSNHGWILIGDEEGICNARRFGSKDEGTAPILEITYTCDAGAPIAICQSLNVYLDDAGEGVILASDIDGGSVDVCDGDITLSASMTSFSCDDVLDEEPLASMVISAVYDGPLPGGLPKGVEVYVINDIADLSEYGVGFANNGGGTDGIEFTFPAVSASAGTYFYISTESSAFADWFGFDNAFTDGDAAINGDDAIELFWLDEVIDVFGEIDVDGSGTAWEYLDGWAHRVSDTGPDGAVFDIANWTFSGPNAWDGETSNATASSPLAIGTYTTDPTTGLTVVLTVTDDEGNEATCFSTIHVFDTLAPVVSCIGATTFVLDESGVMTLAVEDIDAGTTDGCGIESMSLSMTSFSCLDAGENEVMLYATDMYGNVDSCSTTITIDASEVISIVDPVLTSPSCLGFEDGSILIDVLGGSGDYVYDWDNDGTGDFDDVEDLLSLGGGIYVIVVEDEMGCSGTETFELTEPDGMEIVHALNHETCPGAMDGNIDMTVVGGVAPYTYSWTLVGDPDFFETTEDLSGLSAGDYIVMVVDESGCSITQTFTIEVLETIDLTIIEDGIVLTSAQDGATYQWLDCNDDYAPIDGATEQSYTVLGTGDESYAVMITTEGGCVDTTDCFDYLHFTVPEEALNAKIYPNPTSGPVQIKLIGTNGASTLTVFDIKGGVVRTVSTYNSTISLDLSGLEVGVYFVEIKNENSIITKKIALTH